ncbi:MAG: hypothetical protein MPW14_24650 (plasmid) [Candidatus Manganitrophus sp.]|nr:MAG: hypothetical protein MPW14_24650 [Candidatus Manganitrophus sp.]
MEEKERIPRYPQKETDIFAVFIRERGTQLLEYLSSLVMFRTAHTSGVYQTRDGKGVLLSLPTPYWTAVNAIT